MVGSRCRIVGTKLGADKTHKDCAEHVARIVKLEGNDYSSHDRLEVLEGRNNIFDSWYCLLSE